MLGCTVKLTVAEENSFSGGAGSAVELDLLNELVKANRSYFGIFHKSLLMARVEIIGDGAETCYVTVRFDAPLYIKVHQHASHIKKDCFSHRDKDK